VKNASVITWVIEVGGLHVALVLVKGFLAVVGVSNQDLSRSRLQIVDQEFGNATRLLKGLVNLQGNDVVYGFSDLPSLGGFESQTTAGSLSGEGFLLGGSEWGVDDFKLFVNQGTQEDSVLQVDQDLVLCVLVGVAQHHPGEVRLGLFEQLFKSLVAYLSYHFSFSSSWFCEMKCFCSSLCSKNNRVIVSKFSDFTPPFLFFFFLPLFGIIPQEKSLFFLNLKKSVR
jgi:hypothetical protein